MLSRIIGEVRKPRSATFKLKLIANLFLFSGAIIFAVDKTSGATWWLCALFLLGHLGWYEAGRRDRDVNVIFLNVFFMVLDVYAIVVRF